MELFPDKTIFIQVGLFITFWLVFKHVIVGPMTQVLADRHARTVEAERAAVQQASAAEGDRARYDQRVHEQRLRMAQEAETARHAAIAESNEEIAAARSKISLELAHRRDAVTKQVSEARRALAGDADRVAGEMLARVAGGAV